MWCPRSLAGSWGAMSQLTSFLFFGYLLFFFILVSFLGLSRFYHSSDIAYRMRYVPVISLSHQFTLVHTKICSILKVSRCFLLTFCMNNVTNSVIVPEPIHMYSLLPIGMCIIRVDKALRLQININFRPVLQVKSSQRTIYNFFPLLLPIDSVKAMMSRLKAAAHGPINRGGTAAASALGRIRAALILSSASNKDIDCFCSSHHLSFSSPYPLSLDRLIGGTGSGRFWSAMHWLSLT